MGHHTRDIDFEDGLQNRPLELPAGVTRQQDAGHFAPGAGFGVEFEAGRGVRAVYGGGLENRCPDFQGRGFESHPLRRYLDREVQKSTHHFP